MLPDTVDFGAVPVGGDYFGKFARFENATGKAVSASTPYIRGQDGNPFAWFSPVIGRYQLGDDRSVSYGLRFRPPWPGHFEDDFCVPVEDHPYPCVHLRGRGVAALEVAAFQGETAPAVVYLPNPGFRTLDVRIRAGEPWLTPLPSYALIPPGDSLEVVLALNASGLGSGTYRDTLRVDAVGAVEADFVLPLTLEVGGVVAEEDPTGAAERVVVGQAYPNPTRGGVTVPVTLGAPAEVALDVFDVRGRRVQGRALRAYVSGRHALTVEVGGRGAGAYTLVVRVRTGAAGSAHTFARRVSVVE